MTCPELGGKMAVSDLSASYPVLGRHWGALASDASAPDDTS
jgi:hypothetical protein